MRHDFALTATVAGEPLEFIARDAPTAVFFLGFQESFPGADCFNRMGAGETRQILTGMQAWSDALLCRVMVAPRLTPELVQRLGSARDELVVGYLGAVGWMPPDPDLVPAVPVPRDRVSRWPEDHVARLAVPPPTMKIAIREVATKSRVPAYQVWTTWPITAFIWTWHVVLQDDLKKRSGRGGGGASDLMDRVGREAS